MQACVSIATGPLFGRVMHSAGQASKQTPQRQHVPASTWAVLSRSGLASQEIGRKKAGPSTDIWLASLKIADAQVVERIADAGNFIRIHREAHAPGLGQRVDLLQGKNRPDALQQRPG